MASGLEGKVALVAGGTRGAGRGISVELGAAGATVYVTGRSTRGRRSEYDRPETIEETAALVDEAGGRGVAVRVDHLEPDEVRPLVGRIEEEQGRLDVLVNDVWGGEGLGEWNVPVWEHSLEEGLKMLRLAIDTHIITSHFALPLLIRNGGGLVVEMTDGTAEYNEKNYRNSLFYDLAKASVIRIARAQAKELAPHRCAAVALTPGWLRSEMMLDLSVWRSRTGGRRPPESRTSRSRRRRATWAGPWPTSPRIRRSRVGMVAPFRAAGSPRFTVSPISTVRGPTAGATWSRFRTRASRPTRPVTGEPRLLCAHASS